MAKLKIVSQIYHYPISVPIEVPHFDQSFTSDTEKINI